MNDLVDEYIQARKEAEEAEKLLKEKKQAVAYIEEVMYFEGKRQIEGEKGKVSISSATYASVRKADFSRFEHFLKTVNSEASDFLEPHLSLTSQKKLAKFLEEKRVRVPDFIKVYEKPQFKLFKKQGGKGDERKKLSFEF